eukprot:TRINITY_DN68497_c0_g1_i1.p1 TRINITY_DN68497_c0_g1~~TRINITY_DN68497_c0_g1_i1.p1  ORF type:complete len:168 (-),score=19.00 TRINITY_DN68497_c0_g1_i1:989-1438(-)
MAESTPPLPLKDEKDKAVDGLWLIGLSTVMVRGLCTSLTQEAIKDMVDEDGYAGQYDFLYVPLRKEGGKNTSQLFINFVSPEIATDFYDRYHGQSAKFARSDGLLSVLPASRQGYDANLAFFTEFPSVSKPYFAFHSELDIPSPSKESK